MIDRGIWKVGLLGLLGLIGLSLSGFVQKAGAAPPVEPPPMTRGIPEVTATWNGGTGNWNDANVWTFNPANGFTNPHNTDNHLFNVSIDGGNATDSVVSLNLNRSIQTLSLDAGDELRINNFRRLSLFGNVDNQGLLRVATTGSGTYLQPVGEITFSGSGAVVLGGSNAWLYDVDNPNSAPDHLIQAAGHTIRGVGNVGFSNTLRITNAGLIHADTAAGTLKITPNSQGMVNTGDLLASNGGDLELDGGSLGLAVIANTGGKIEAASGSTVSYRNNPRIVAGELIGAGTHAIIAGNASFQNLTLTHSSTVNINNGRRLSLFGDIVNDGEIRVDTSGLASYLQPVDTVNLSGAGEVVLGGNNAWLYDSNNPNSAPDHLIQAAGHTIRGVGNVGFANNLRITNHGLIHADVDGGTLSLRPNDQGMVNSGAMLASGGGNLEFRGDFLDAAVIANDGAVIEAGLYSSVTYTRNSHISGGELTGDGTHVIGLGNARFDNLSNSSTVNINNIQTLDLLGTIVNDGQIRIDAINATLLRPIGEVSLIGSGELVLGGANARIERATSPVDPDHLVQGAEHSIRGLGRIGNVNFLQITNHGLIHADTDGGTLEIRPNSSGLQNSGTMRASNGGILTLTTTNGVLTSLVNNQLTEGSYEVIGASTMRLGAAINDNAATILLDGPASNLFSTTTNNALANFATNQGSFTIRNGRDFTTAGAFNNSGLLHSGTGSTFTLGSGQALTNTGTLAGAGTIVGEIENAGLLSPGDSIGALIVIGDLLVGDGTSYDWEIDGISSDLISVNNGTLSFNGGTVTINVQFDGSPPAEGLDHVLIDASNATIDQANLPDFVVELPLGWATDGVVVTTDQVLLSNLGRVFDFGDAPDGPDFPGFNYGTLRGNDGPRHIVNGPWLADFAIAVGDLMVNDNDTTAERDGQPDDEADKDEADNGVILADFRAIPVGGRVTCDGVEMPNDELLDEFAYCAAVRVANPTSNTAYLAAWVDFGATGNFNGPIDRASPQVLLGESGMVDFGGGDCDVVTNEVQPGQPLSTLDYAIPAFCEGLVVVVWPYSSSDTITNQASFSRFRISTDATWGSNPSPLGELPDGEVEDHFLDAGTIPVSVHAFESEFTAEGLVVRWSTASETHNMGFYLWGQLTASGRFELLSPQMIDSSASDIVEPQNYSVTIPGLSAGDVGDLMLTAVDYFGNEEMYGYFSSGYAYGELNPPDPIDWASIRDEVEGTLARAGRVSAGGVWRDPQLSRRLITRAADFLVTEAGMQRISFEDLLAMGLNLAGTDMRQIAVTVKGRGVPRAIDSGAAGGATNTARGTGAAPFGPGGAILFWGEKPELPMAKFIDQLVYRVEVNGSQAVEMGDYHLPVSQPSDLARASQRRADDVAYNFSNPAPDPWFMAELRSWQPSRSRFDAIFVLDDALESSQLPRIQVDISGLTAAPLGPDHRIRVEINGTQVGEHSFSGRSVERLVMEVPANLLNVGANTVRVRSVGFAGIRSITLLDAVELSWAEQARVGQGPLMISPLLADGQDGLLVEGLGAMGDAQAFARSAEQVYRIAVEAQDDTGLLGIPAGTERIWASSVDQFHVPQGLGAVAANELMSNLGNLLVISHAAFLPTSASEAHPLNVFVDHRRAQGWNVAVVDISDIQLHYGGGMPLPQALMSFLADAVRHLRAHPHVLLVGGDSFDYRDLLNQGSLSFIPTTYAATRFVPHTPSDALLADLNGDGLAELPLGRWPVRSLADLQAHVDKVMDWEINLADHWSALWLTDERDPNLAPFRGQAERLSELMIGGGVMSWRMDQIIFEDVGSAGAARAELFSALAQGRTLTGFSGHGSPTMWSFQGILRPSDVANLNNHGLPTLIGTMACYTTYFSSPFSNTLAHRLMNGLNADGVSPDRNGAVAVHGAATLSSMSHNEAFMRDVLTEQMAGRTLGEAIQLARTNAAQRGHGDLVVNWTLLGDPTLQLLFSRGMR